MWLPTWQPRLSGVKVHTPWVNGIRAKSLVFAPVSWAFPRAPSARRRDRPDVRSPRGGAGWGWGVGAGPQAAARAPRAWVRASMVRPSLCSRLPLEAASRPYIILASLFYCSRWTFLAQEELKFVAARCLEAGNGQQAHLHFHRRKLWSRETACCNEATDLTWILGNWGHLSLWVSITQEKMAYLI